MRPSEILQYKGNLNWFNESVLLLTKHGSQAYGTNTPTSDLDIKGICIPPLKYFLGFQYKFEQMEMKDPYDTVVYDIRKFFSLAADNNPNIIEVLWTDPTDHLYMHPLMETVLDNRDLFLSKKAKHTFSGYAVSQLKRIQTHYRWLKNPPTSPPTREELGLPERTVVPKDQLQAAESAIEKLYLKWVNFDSVMDKLTEDEKIQLKADVASLLVSNKVSEEDIRRHAGITLGYDSNFLLLLEKERLYTTKRREWEQFQNWKATRNATRSALEEKFGYDTKHAMHLVRLMRMCREILTGKGVVVKRPDAAELLEIRNGAWKYEDLIEWAEAQDMELEELAKTSSLPKMPDRDRLDAICMSVVDCFLNV